MPAEWPLPDKQPTARPRVPIGRNAVIAKDDYTTWVGGRTGGQAAPIPYFVQPFYNPAHGLVEESLTYMSDWVLALSYWLHMLATIVWVGGLALMALVIWPAARAMLGPGPQLADLFSRLQRRFNPWAWGSLALLIVTGLTQMTANENYDGLLRLTNNWAVVILLKHIAVGGMVLIGVYQQWSVQPALVRLVTLQAHGRIAPGLEALRAREVLLTRLNLACGVLVLAFTAIARVL